MNMDQAVARVRFCKIGAAYAENKSKLVLSLGSTTPKCLTDSLIQLGGSLKTGVAPMGHLERILQTLLDSQDDI